MGGCVKAASSPDDEKSKPTGAAVSVALPPVDAGVAEGPILIAGGFGRSVEGRMSFPNGREAGCGWVRSTSLPRHVNLEAY